MKSSYLISFEGIEGSGKSTQIQLLKELLLNKGFRVKLLREPGGTLFGEQLRSAILNSQTPIAPISEALLFASSRAQLVTQEVLPFLNEEKSIVIIDRYIDSSLAYQGEARELGFDTILDLHKHSPLDLMPDLTLYLKIDLETSFKRQDLRGNKKDYFEKEKEQFYGKLIKGYDKCAQQFQRVKVIDASKEIPEVSLLIQSCVESDLKI